VERVGLRVVAGGAAAKAIEAPPDSAAFQEECLRAFGASQVARGFSELTIVTGRARCSGSWMPADVRPGK
jgi:hypothetical protein